ncbi:MAG: glycolate oxidase subunit GlcE [Burkholderiaceae bacterium]|nr:glycolate oxidase subunit GlcE [Burkholderiaceae bacterium]
MDLPAAPLLPQILDRIKAAASAAAPLRIRGGGSKDFYGQSLQGEILDTTGLTGITSYEPSELVVTVRAGTPLAELEAVLAEENQCLPFEPPHFKAGTTVGGMVAAGLSGPSRASSGGVRDFMLGVSMVNGKAEQLTFGGQVMKNVAGYDVSRLMAGSLGTLGLITEVSLKVLPIAPAEATLKFEYPQAEAIKRLNVWLGHPLPLHASCWLEDGGVPSLYVRLRGAVAAVHAAVQRMGGELQDEHSGHPAVATVAARWRALRDQTLPFFKLQPGESLWRLSVPDTTPDLELEELGQTLVEWHGAQRWVKVSMQDPASAALRLRERVHAVGGSATLFVASQADNAAAIPVFSPLKPPLDRIHRDLKRQFDPAGIFNRGRMFADM